MVKSASYKQHKCTQIVCNTTTGVHFVYIAVNINTLVRVLLVRLYHLGRSNF